MHRPLGRYLISFGLIALSTLLGIAVRGNLEPTNIVMLYLASVIISAIFLGRVAPSSGRDDRRAALRLLPRRLISPLP